MSVSSVQRIWRAQDAIDVLFAFSAPQDWQPGARPIIWPSNCKLETTLGLARRQVQNVLNALIRGHLITPVDSPTGRRWGHRDAKTGKIIEAYFSRTYPRYHHTATRTPSTRYLIA